MTHSGTVSRDVMQGGRGGGRDLGERGGVRIIMGKAAIWREEEDMVPIQGCV